MDPNFFHVDLERAFEVFVALVLLSMILERGLALIFEHRWYVNKYDNKGYKTFIAFGAALFLCWHWKFDALSIIVLQESNSWPGYILTAGVIAGGSKASIKLFHDFLGVRSRALAERRAATPNDAEPETPKEDANE